MQLTVFTIDILSKEQEQQLERNLDLAKRSAQAVISDLENKLHSLEKTHQEQLVTGN